MNAALQDRMARFLAWRRSEPRTLELMVLFGALLYAFVQIASEVIEGDTRHYDEALLRFLRNPADLNDPLGPWWVELMFRDLTALGGTSVLALLTTFAIGYLFLIGKRANALLVVVAVVGGALLSHFLKLGFDRPRPEVVAKLAEVRTLSFPSGHAMLSAVTYMTLGALVARVQGGLHARAYLMSIAVILTVVVGSSRVYLGVHYPSDVLAGWCAGAAWALACWLVARRLERRGTVEPPAPASPSDVPAPTDTPPRVEPSAKKP